MLNYLQTFWFGIIPTFLFENKSIVFWGSVRNYCHLENKIQTLSSIGLIYIAPKAL